LICDTPEFNEFKEVICATGHTGITRVDGDIKFSNIARKVFESHQRSIEEVKKALLLKVNQI